jgi:dihydrofolate synthase/folylpolyglutamate synthase
MGDKDIEGALIELEKVMDSIIVTKNSSSRSAAVADVEALASKIFGADRVFSAESLEAAIEKAIKDSIRPLSEETIGILITGSVVTAGEARTIVRKRFAKADS